MSEKQFVYAVWEVEQLPEDLSSVHISCGVHKLDDNHNEIDDIQYDGFFLEDTGAKLTVENLSNKYRIVYAAPSCDLEKDELIINADYQYWLSPSCMDETYEAIAFGMTDTPDNIVISNVL